MKPEEIVIMAIQTFRLEDLSDKKLRTHVEVRSEGLGVCSRCRWQSGCLSCDPEKAWRWAVSKELGMSLRIVNSLLAQKASKDIEGEKGDEVKKVDDINKDEEVKKVDEDKVD